MHSLFIDAKLRPNLDKLRIERVPTYGIDVRFTVGLPTDLKARNLSEGYLYWVLNTYQI